MLPKDLFQKFLQLDEGWEPSDIQYCQDTGTLIVAVKETPALWHRQSCPRCRSRRISHHGHAKKRGWRHLDGFNVKTLIECALPRGKCAECGHIFQVEPGWQGKSRHFTRGFEAFALSLIRETTVRNASKVLSEKDQRLWRMLFAYVEGAQGKLSTVAISILHREWNKGIR